MEKNIKNSLFALLLMTIACNNSETQNVVIVKDTIADENKKQNQVETTPDCVDFFCETYNTYASLTTEDSVIFVSYKDSLFKFPQKEYKFPFYSKKSSKISESIDYWEFSIHDSLSIHFNYKIIFPKSKRNFYLSNLKTGLIQVYYGGGFHKTCSLTSYTVNGKKFSYPKDGHGIKLQ